MSLAYNVTRLKIACIGCRIAEFTYPYLPLVCRTKVYNLYQLIREAG